MRRPSRYVHKFQWIDYAEELEKKIEEMERSDLYRSVNRLKKENEELKELLGRCLNWDSSDEICEEVKQARK